MKEIHAISIRYFLVMTFMLLATGVWLLLLHTSFTLESFTTYYVQKSLFGLLEILTPHLFAMGTVIFVLTHFLSLHKQNTVFENRLTLMLFLLMLISNFSGFLITESTTYLVWLKISSIILFLFFSLLTMWRVFYRT